jgi:hypothetical protein
MTYRTVPFKRWHLSWIEERGSSEGGFFAPDLPTLMALEQMPNMWTMLWEDEPLLCGGTIQHWPGRAEAWAYLNKHTGRHMIYVTKSAIEKVSIPKGRVEFTVLRNFAKGHRWARLLGFDVEACPGLEVEKLPPDLIIPGQMRGWSPEGIDGVLYVRHNK